METFDRQQTRTCPFCQSEISKKAKKCPQCGSMVNLFNCRNCCCFIVFGFMALILISVYLATNS